MVLLRKAGTLPAVLRKPVGRWNSSARHSIEHTDNPNRAHESRTESEAKSMATQVNPLEEYAAGTKAGRRGSKAKEQQA
jgi:hypothetical protein